MTWDVHYTQPSRVWANGIEIVYDSFGDPGRPPLLLVMGLGGQMVAWDEELCVALAQHGYWVIRFDNRDVGLSTRLDDAGVPDILAMYQALFAGEAIQAPYLLSDMAGDAVGLLDTLEIPSAHVVGISMGGMIAQSMAIHHPARVRTLTSIMSSTGNPDLPPPTADAMGVLLNPAPAEREAYIAHELQVWRVLNGPRIPLDEARVRERAGGFYDRGLSPEGTARQLAAILASGSRVGALGSLTVPTLVIHGDADPLVPVEGGIDTANVIPGAELLIIEGMGHDIPLSVAPRVIEAIARHAV